MFHLKNIKHTAFFLLAICCLVLYSCNQSARDKTKKDDQFQHDLYNINNSSENDSLKAIEYTRLLAKLQNTSTKWDKSLDSIYDYLFNQWIADPERFKNIPSLLTKAANNDALSSHNRLSASLYRSLVYYMEYKIPQLDSMILKLGNQENEMDDANKILYYRNLGLQLNIRNQSQEATTIFQKAIELVQKNPQYNSCELGNIYCNYASIYLKLNDNNKALELLQKAYKLLSINNCNSNDLQSTIINIGVSYINLHKLDSGIIYYKKQLPLITNNSARNYTMSFVAYLNIGGAFIEQKKYDSARLYLDKAAFISDKIKDENLAVLLNTFSAIADAPIKDVSKQVEKIKGYVTLFYKNNDLYDVQNAYEALNKIASIKHQDKEALYYLEKLDSIKEIVTSAENKKMVNELEVKYQTAQKDLKLKTQETEIAQKQNWIIGLLSLLLLTALATLLLSFQFKLKSRKKEVLLQQQFTSQLIDQTELERSRIARDLHDGVNQELMLLKEMVNPNGNSVLKIESIIKEIRDISHNLHPEMLDKIGLQKSLEMLCEQMMETNHLFISWEISYTAQLNKKVELQLFRIVQESIKNTLKHAAANAIKVSLFEVNNQLQLEIKDNGKGFDVAKILASGNSFGLNSIIARSKSVEGTVSISSIPHQETLIKIILPI